MTVKRKCVTCSRAFVPHLNHPNQTHCSHACIKTEYKANRAKVRASRKFRCPICRKPFSSLGNHVVFCSVACRKKAKKARDRRSLEKWKKKNTKASKAYNRDYYQKNKKRMDATNGRWREANKSKIHIYSQTRRALENGTNGSCSVADLDRIWLKQDGKCANPHCHIKLTKRTRQLDHKNPLSKGGSNYPRNLQWMCRPCNSIKRDKPWSAFLAEWIH